MSDIRLRIGPPGPDNLIEIDGVNVADRIRGLTFQADRHSVPTLTLEYVCIGTADISGDAQVIHNCPLRGEVASL